MNRPDSPTDSGDPDAGTAPAEDDDEDFGGHIGNATNLESGAPAYADTDDDDPDDDDPDDDDPDDDDPDDEAPSTS